MNSSLRTSGTRLALASLCFLVLLLLIAGHPARAETFPVTHLNNIEILQPYGFPALEKRNGGLFLEIHNVTDADDRLIAARSQIADTVELHNHTMENGIMQMREVDGINIPAGGKVVLEPMGYHIMLIGMKKNINIGDDFPLTLEFENSGQTLVKAVVVKPTTKPAIYDRYKSEWKCSCSCDKDLTAE